MSDSGRSNNNNYERVKYLTTVSFKHFKLSRRYHMKITEIYLHTYIKSWGKNKHVDDDDDGIYRKMKLAWLYAQNTKMMIALLDICVAPSLYMNEKK